MSDAVKAFKNELASYPILKDQLAERKKQLDQIQYIMNGVRAVRADSEPHGNAPEGNRIILYLARKEAVESEIKRLCERLAYVDDVMEFMNEYERYIINEHYNNNRTYADIADELGYTTNWIMQKVDKEIEVCIRAYENTVFDQVEK